MFYFNLNFLFWILSLFQLLKKNKLLINIGCLIFILVSGMRYKTGLDWLMYIEYFSLSMNEIIKKGNTDIGYIYLCELFKICGISYFGMQFLISCFVGIITFKFYTRYSKYSLFYIFIYFNMYYLRYNMGLQKQIIAVSFCMLSFHYLQQNKILKSLFCYAIAISFHFSALVFVLLYLLKKINIRVQIIVVVTIFITIVILKINLINTILKALLFLFDILKLDFFGNKILSYLGNEYYGRESVIGKNLIIRIILIFILLFFKKNKEKNIILSMTNCYIFFSCLSLNFHVLDRLQIYFGIFAIISFSEIIELIKLKNLKILIYFLLSCYFSQSTLNLTFFQERTRHYKRFIPYCN